MSAAHPEVELHRGGFQPPPSPPTDPLDPLARISRPGLEGDGEAESPRPSESRARAFTAASSPGSAVTAATLAKTLTGGLLIVAALASWALRWRNRELRRPTHGELHEITAPAARIMLRHVDVALEARLLQDAADACDAAAGLVAYLETDPISRRRAPEPPPAPEPEE